MSENMNNQKINPELLQKALYKIFSTKKKGNLTQLFNEKKNMAEVFKHFTLMNRANQVLFEGGFAAVFYNFDPSDLPFLNVCLMFHCPIFYTHFKKGFDYFEDLSIADKISFYSFGMFHTDENRDQFYVRDKLNFLGKGYWREDITLSNEVELFLDNNKLELIHFIETNNIQNVLETLEPQIHQEIEPSLVDYIDPEKNFRIKNNDLIWLLPSDELKNLKNLRISIDFNLESLNIDFSLLESLESLQVSSRGSDSTKSEKTGLLKFPTGFGCCKSLQEIRFILTQIEDVSYLEKDLLQLPKLETLTISNNLITIIPEFICQIKTLKNLDFSYNQSIIKLPKNINKLIQLERLDLSKNKLSAIPKTLQRLTNLKDLNLSWGEITQIPNFLYEITSLESLNLSKNFIKSISSEIKNLQNLKNLYLLDNHLSDLPIEICSLHNLEFANVLTDNDLTKINLEIKDFLEGKLKRTWTPNKMRNAKFDNFDKRLLEALNRS